MRISFRAGLVLAALSAALLAGTAEALPQKLSPEGRADFAWGDAGTAESTPTSEKPESKLFYTPDGRWWAVLGVGGSGLHLHELVDHAWQARVALPGSAPWYRADALFDARSRTLFVAARDDRPTPGPTGGVALYRMRYRGEGAWTTPRGPSVIPGSAPETVTIARDGKRRLWTTWEGGGNVRVQATRPGRLSFSDVRPPARGLTEDDISAITAFGSRRSGKVGVLWSDQATGRFRFGWRRDGERRGRWHVETAYGAGLGCESLCADDHINMKAIGNSVYAVVKTSRNDMPSPNPADPLIVLLRRNPRGRWTAFPVSPVSLNSTRPALLLAPRLDAIWVFARAERGDIAVWESRFASPAFDSAAFSSWTGAAGNFGDPTTTRQPIPPGRGAVVATAKIDAGEYWHNEFLP